MAGFKAPDFNERSAAARDAKQRALEKLRDKAPPDPAMIAERQAAQAAREAAAAEKRAERQRVIDEGKAAKAAAREAAEAEAQAERERQEAAAAAAKRPMLNAAELKAARDARYAARKARQR